jgi:two-component system, chemotaxis family, chemotaxis protein CheY
MPGPSPPSPRVLVVDDSIVVRQVLSFTLRLLPEFMEAAIEQAGNGAVALRKLGESRYDLVLCDIRMPYMDGLELVQRARRDLKLATPIVLISTLGTDEDVQRGLQAGATAYLIKPIAPHYIKQALRELLDRGVISGRPQP